MWGFDTPLALAALVIFSVCIAAFSARAEPAADGPVKLRALPQFPKVPQGGKLVIAVEMDHGTKYHSWPAAEVQLPASVADFAVRTEIGLEKDKDGKPAPPAWIKDHDGTQYPPAKVGKAPDPTGEKPTIDVPLYAKKAVAFVRLNVKPDAPLGEQTGTILVSYQACDDAMCFAPEDAVVKFKVTVVASGTSDLGGPADAELFKAFDATKWGAKPASEPAKPAAAEKEKDKEKEKPKPTSQAPTGSSSSGSGGTPVASMPTGGSLFGVQLGSSVGLLFLAAVFGGMILNLTPCVLPVVPIKVLTLTQHTKSKSHAIALGAWMFAGVVAFWAAIGIPMAFVSAALDPSQFIFGTWWVTFSIGIIIVILALGIMGMFTINLPQSVYAVEAKADSPVGSFMFGVLTAVLGLPCFGFVAGSLLAAAATLPALTIMAIFVGIGAGMGLPYLVLSAYPNLLKFIPRTGPASELVKQVMGVLLLAAAAFFITASIQSLLKERPYLSGSMTWWAVGFFVAAAAIWMVIRTFQIAKAVWPKLVMPVLGVIMTLGIGVFAQDRLNQDHSTYLARLEAERQGIIPSGVWLEYTPEKFAAVQASNRPIFLDFTADWCTTCKALKAALLDREPLKSQFKLRGVVLMEVDTTVKTGTGSQLLKSLGRTGVPTWAVFAPGAGKPHFVPVESPTSATVLAELDTLGIKLASESTPNTRSASTASR